MLTTMPDLTVITVDLRSYHLPVRYLPYKLWAKYKTISTEKVASEQNLIELVSFFL